MAGLDAGHAYNDFPWMNGKLLPDEYFCVPGWRNAFESTAAVQLHHRALALTSLGAVGALWLAARQQILPPSAQLLLHALLGVTGLQVALGVTTLWTNVHEPIAAAHQANALMLFTVSLALLHCVRGPAGGNRLLRMAGTPAALVAVGGVGWMAIQTV